jgi:hypothetical protein
MRDKMDTATLREMPSSLNDALRKMELAADVIERLKQERDDAVADALRLHNEKMDYFDRVVAAEYDRDAERERCASIAEAIDSGRGNEKMIAAAIRTPTVKPAPHETSEKVTEATK